MRRSKKSKDDQRRPFELVGEPDRVEALEEYTYLEEHTHLLQVHPLPESRTGVLSVANHLVHRFAAEQGRDVPGLSRDAATFLGTRSWALDDLARRLWQAVAVNLGSLITASDLSD
jgi:transcriptional regulator of aromatic amino acid metabolism